jgi:hypothetical protein
MIEVEKLTSRYRPFTVVDGVTFTARPGQVTGFLALNGAGGAGRDPGNRCRWPAWTLLPDGQRTAGFFAASGHAGSRFTARLHRR